MASTLQSFPLDEGGLQKMTVLESTAPSKYPELVPQYQKKKHI